MREPFNVLIDKIGSFISGGSGELTNRGERRANGSCGGGDGDGG